MGKNNGANEQQGIDSSRAEGSRYQRTMASATVTIAVLTLAIVLVGVAAAIIYWHQLEAMNRQLEAMNRQLDEMEQTRIGDQRAWIAPRRAKIDWEKGRFAPGHILHFVIGYGNVGKHPALGFVAQQKVKAFKHPGPNRSWYETFTPAHIEHVCQKTRATDEGGTIYPSEPSEYAYEVSTDELPITEAIMEGREVLYVEGCFAYKTLGGERKSAYCFMLVPQNGTPPEEWSFKFCVRGNDAT